MNPLLSRLAALRRRVLIVEGWRGVTALLSLLIGAVLFAGLVDWTIQLPSLVRGMLLVTIVAGSGLVAYRYLIAPLACPVDNLSLALRVEEAYPELNDALASTVQFLTEPQDTPGAASSSPAMRDKAVQQAMARSASCDFSSIVSYRGALISGASFILIAAAAAHFVYRYPQFTGIALARLADPFGGHTWTTVDVPDAPTVVARGQPLSIKATLAGLIPRTAKIEVVEEGTKGDETPRPDEKNYQLAPGTSSIKHALDMTKYTKNFKFRVVANDGTYPKSGRWHAVSVLAPPKHVELDGQPSPQVEVFPPSYTELKSQELTPGTKMIKAWAGSQVVFKAATDRKVANVWFEYRPRDVFAAPPVPAFRAAALLGALSGGEPRPGLGELFLGQSAWDRVPAEIDSTGVMYTVRFVPWVPGTCVVHLEDEIGLANKYVYELDVEIDPMPNVRMMQPATDLTLKPNAEPTFKFQADDETFALRSFYVEFERRGSEGGAVERRRVLLQTTPGYEQNLPLIKAPLLISDAVIEPLKTKPRRVEITSTWRLANQFKVGDELFVEACADDYCDIYGIRAPARSHQIKIRIVSDGELAKVIGEKLEGVQKNVDEIEKMQKAAQDVVKEIEKNPKATQKDIEKIVEAEAATKQILEKVGNPDEGLRNDLAKLQQLLRDNKMQDTEAQQQAGMIKGALELLAQQEEQIEAALNQARKDLAAKANKDPKEKKDSKDDPKKADPLAKAGKLQDSALQNIQELQKAMQPWASMEKAKAEVRGVLDQQQQLKKELEGLKTAKEKLDLAGPDANLEDQKQLQDDLNKKADQLTDLAQRAEKLKGLIEDMQKNRAEKGDKVNADRLKEAGKIADKAQLPSKMRDVAKELRNNREPKLGETQKPQRENIDNLEKMLAALDGKDDAALEALKQKHEKAKENVEALAKKLKDLENKLADANKLKNEEERLKKKEELAKEFGDIKEDADKLARELARLQETRAAQDLAKLGQDAEKAADKLKGGGDPAEEQKAVQNDLQKTKNDMKQFEEELAREQLAKIADRLQGFLEREETAIDRSKEFNKRLLAKKNWSSAFVKSIEGDANSQDGLAKEVRSLKDKIKEAKVFEHILERSARSMDDAVDVMKNRKQAGVDARQRDPKTDPPWDADDMEAENDSSKTTVRHQGQAAGGLKRLIDSIKEELAKKPPEPKQDDAGGAEEMPPDGPQFKAQDGIPPMAQLKALQAEQKDLKSRTEEFSKRNPDTMKLDAQQRNELERIQQDQRSLQDLFRQITAGADKKGDAP